MATQLSWSTPTAIVAQLATELNALANGAYTAASSAIDNTTLRHLYTALQLRLASLTPATGNTGISVYLLPCTDTTFPDGGGAVVPGPENYVCCFAALSTGAGAKARDLTGLPVPPFAFKLVALNGAGVSLAASGNTLAYRLYSEQSS